MTLPKLHYISQGASLKEHLEHIQNACSSGAELVQLRLKHIPLKEVLATAAEAREITAHFQTRLIINDYYKIAKEVKADGVHLGKTDTDPDTARKALESWQIIGGTANTLQDCLHLIKKDVDYIGLGPFRYTTTKTNLSPTLGLEGYAHIINELQTNTPIIAIGGITVNDISNILSTGAYGIAASGEITRNFDNINMFNTRLKHSDQLKEQVWKPNQNSTT